MSTEVDSLRGPLDARFDNKQLGKENDERKHGANELARSLSKKIVFKQNVPSHVFEALALQERCSHLKPVPGSTKRIKEEEEESEAAGKLKGNLNGIGFHLKMRPKLGKQLQTTEVDWKNNSNGRTTKKWATIQIGLGPEHADLPVLLNGNLATPVDLGSDNHPLQWREELTRVSCINSINEAKRGVVAAELVPSDITTSTTSRIVILKSGSNGAQEVFSGLIGERLGIRCPRIRVVEDSSERQAIEGSIFDLLVNNAYYQTNTLRYLQQSKQLLLMEAGTHRVTLDKFAESNKTIGIDLAFEFGVMIPFDMIIANGDRLPLKGVWDRPRNAHNFLFPIDDRKGHEDSALLFAIDQVCTHPRNETLLDSYLAAIADTLSSIESLKSALEFTVAFMGRASNTKLLPGMEESLLAGVREGVQRVARLSREDLVAIFNRVREMGSTNAWREQLHANVNLDIMCDIIDICKQCPLNES